MKRRDFLTVAATAVTCPILPTVADTQRKGDSDVRKLQIREAICHPSTVIAVIGAIMSFDNVICLREIKMAVPSEALKNTPFAYPAGTAPPPDLTLIQYESCVPLLHAIRQGLLHPDTVIDVLAVTSASDPVWTNFTLTLTIPLQALGGTFFDKA